MMRLLICDLDGTLVDSSIDLTNALNYAVEPYDIEKMTVQRTKSLVGEGITRLIEKLLGLEMIAIRQAVMDRFMEYYAAHLVDFTRPYAGVPETLASLHRYKKLSFQTREKPSPGECFWNSGCYPYFDWCSAAIVLMRKSLLRNLS